MSIPAQPFIRVASSAGYSAANLAHLWAWLQSDTVHGYRVRPTRLDVGSEVYALLGSQPTVRVDADDANPDQYETGPRQSPRDDLTFVVQEVVELPPDSVYLMQQIPPGLQPG